MLVIVSRLARRLTRSVTDSVFVSFACANFFNHKDVLAYGRTVTKARIEQEKYQCPNTFERRVHVGIHVYSSDARHRDTVYDFY
jgi:hypothetical protein